MQKHTTRRCLDLNLNDLQQYYVECKKLKEGESLVKLCHASPNSFKKSVESSFLKIRKYGPEILKKDNQISLKHRYDLFVACIILSERKEQKLKEWRTHELTGLYQKFITTYITETLAALTSLAYPGDNRLAPNEADWNLFRQSLARILTPRETQNIGGTLDYTTVVEHCASNSSELGWYRLYRLPGILQLLTDYGALINSFSVMNSERHCNLLIQAYRRATETWVELLAALNKSELSPHLAVLQAILN